MESIKTFAQELEETGRVVYTIRGVSMRPLLRQGKDVVVIERPIERCKKHDVVLFLRKNGQYVLHRVLKEFNDRFWIVGDNCYSGEMVNDNQIIGILTSIKRGQKTIKMTDLDYRLYIHIWCDAYPVRFLILWLKTKTIRALSYVKRRALHWK